MADNECLHRIDTSRRWPDQCQCVCEGGGASDRPCLDHSSPEVLFVNHTLFHSLLIHRYKNLHAPGYINLYQWCLLLISFLSPTYPNIYSKNLCQINWFAPFFKFYKAPLCSGTPNLIVLETYMKFPLPPELQHTYALATVGKRSWKPFSVTSSNSKVESNIFIPPDSTGSVLSSGLSGCTSAPPSGNAAAAQSEKFADLYKMSMPERNTL